MKHTTTALLSLCLVATNAADLVKTPKQYLLLKPAKPIVIDGKLDEWDLAASPYIISPTSKSPLSSVLPNDPANPPKGDADLSGRAALAWDESCLYVAGQMVDDHLMGVRPNSAGNQGPPGWGCDSLMVLVHSFRQPMKTNSPYSKTPFFGLRYAPTGPDPRGKLAADARKLDKRGQYWVLTKGAKWATVETPAGYNVEAAIPWSDIEYVPRPGERLFMSFLAADVDPDEALVQIGWGYSGQPKECPVFRLVEREDVLGLLTISADEVPTDKDWAVRAELAALTGGTTIATVRIRDEKGKTVLERQMGVAVREGMTGTAVAEFPAGAIDKPGNYTVELLARAGDEIVVVATGPVLVVEPKPAPPLVANLPGEIRHAPPDRIAHHAWDEHRRKFYRHGFVKSKEDYVPFIRRWVEPDLKSRARQAIKTKSKWGSREAFHCMAMHRITGDEEYVGLARDLMSVMLDLQQKGTGWHMFTPTAMYRYLTWLRDPASPYAPADAEQRYRQIFHYAAAKPSAWLFTESGTHNRVWHRYAQLKAARLVAEEDGKPMDPRIADYTDYHDRIIGDVGDDDDASAGYHWVFFDAAASLYFHTGDWDAFLDNRGFRRTLDRYVEMVSPSGACVPFGSCSGWPEVGQSMWAYEWMSNLTRDGRFRWASHRIAEYYYNHLTPHANQYHGPFDVARHGFVLAYLLADDEVTPKAAPPHSRVTWRHPTVDVPLEQLRARPGHCRRMMDASQWVPDKVVLSTSNRAQDLWGLVELLPRGGHAGELPGNLIALMAHDAALLAGQGYYELTPDYSNLMWIEDLDGLASDPRPTTTDVPIFVDDPAFTFVRVRTTAFQQLPVVYTRDLLFYKNGFVVVKDRVKFESTMKVRLGPCYQARCLGPQCGEHWFNTYFDQLYYTGLGLGRGVQAIRNPSWDLLVYFTPRPGRKHTVQDRFLDNIWRNAPVQLRQTWSGMARAGQKLSFTSVLLPHVPTITPKHLIEPPPESKEPTWIEVARDDDSVTVVKAIAELDPLHKFRREIWVMINDTEEMVSAGPIESDALVAVVGHDRRGGIQHRALVGGSVLRYRDQDESARARKLDPLPVQMPKELAE